MKKQGISYFENEWEKHLSPEKTQFCKEMYEKHGTIIMVDNSIVEYQSTVLGSAYGAGSYGWICFFRSRDIVENRTGLVRHEVIHSKQDEISFNKKIGFIKKRTMSLKSMLQILSKYK